MKPSNKGGAILDLLFVLGFIALLFIAWVALGGPRPGINPYTSGFPNAPIVSTSTIDQATSTSFSASTSSSTIEFTDQNITLIAIVIGIGIIAAAYISNGNKSE